MASPRKDFARYDLEIREAIRIATCGVWVRFKQCNPKRLQQQILGCRTAVLLDDRKTHMHDKVLAICTATHPDGETLFVFPNAEQRAKARQEWHNGHRAAS